MENLDFTEDEIQDQLVLLGYENIPKHKLSEFKKGWFYFYLSTLCFLSFHSTLSKMIIIFAVLAISYKSPF